LGESPGKKLFIKRLELMGELDWRIPAGDGCNVKEADCTGFDPESEAEVRDFLGARLHREVAAMNLHNFVVRPWRRWDGKYLFHRQEHKNMGTGYIFP
jgi:type I restriction enzyme, R subunit